MADEPVTDMEQMVSLDFETPPPSPSALTFLRNLRAGRITAHKCPECARVYMPPRAFCPICVVTTGDDDEVEVADRGTVATFSVITPIQYKDQQEKEDYIQANILLDGSDTTAMMQRLEGIPVEEARTGLRVEAVWLPEGERGGDDDGGGWGRGAGLGAAISGFRPTGEPDVQADKFADHLL